MLSASGALRGWSIAQQAYTLDVALGGTPNMLEISADGQFLVAGNGATASLTRLNLTTRAADTMGGGNQMILVGVTLSTLPTGWITGG